MKNENYYHLNHCRYKIQYHFILSTKYRRKILNGEIKNVIINSFKLAETKSNNQWKIIICEVDKDKSDHVHLLIETKPTISPYEIIHKLKQISTYYIYHTSDLLFQKMKKIYWKKQHILWTRGYFCTSIGNVSDKILKQYIENQG